MRSARARSTQSRSAVSVRSRSRATLPTALALVEHQAHRLGLEVVSRIAGAAGAWVSSAIGLDIVSTFRKMSTKPDQAHFNFTAVEPGQLKELAAVTKKGIAGFKNLTLPWA